MIAPYKLASIVVFNAKVDPDNLVNRKRSICVTNDHEYVPFVVITDWTFLINNLS